MTFKTLISSPIKGGDRSRAPSEMAPAHLIPSDLPSDLPSDNGMATTSPSNKHRKIDPTVVEEDGMVSPRPEAKMLWAPSPEDIEKSKMTEFRHYVNHKHDLSLGIHIAHY